MGIGAENKNAAGKFRRWLVERVAETSWVFAARGATNRELARYLGIDPEVIVDARRFLDSVEKERTERTGLVKARIGANGRPQVIDHKKSVKVRTPIFIHAEWNRVMEARGLRGTTVMRSLVHYLLTTPEYKPTRDVWLYNGKRYYAGAAEKWTWHIELLLPSSVWNVLERRAKSLRMNIPSLGRNLILDFLEGKLPQLPMITNSEQLWEPNRYYAGPPGVYEAARIKVSKRGRRSLTRKELDREERRARRGDGGDSGSGASGG